jgi:hypothetical protein
VAQAVKWGYDLDVLLDMPIDRFTALTQDLTDLRNQEKIESLHAGLIGSQGDMRAYNKQIKLWKAGIRKPNKNKGLDAIKAVASDLNKRGRRS